MVDKVSQTHKAPRVHQEIEAYGEKRPLRLLDRKEMMLPIVEPYYFTSMFMAGKKQSYLATRTY